MSRFLTYDADITNLIGMSTWHNFKGLFNRDRGVGGGGGEGGSSVGFLSSVPPFLKKKVLVSISFPLPKDDYSRG